MVESHTRISVVSPENVYDDESSEGDVTDTVDNDEDVSDAAMASSTWAGMIVKTFR